MRGEGGACVVNVACIAKGPCMAGGVQGKGGGVRAGETATEADGTHPTGMHSCFHSVFFKILPK